MIKEIFVGVVIILIGYYIFSGGDTSGIQNLINQVSSKVSETFQSQSTTGLTNLNELIQNPQNYIDKEVKIIRDTKNFGCCLNDYSGTNLKYYLFVRNEEGRPIYLPIDYPQFYCQKCEITGTIRSFETCNCERYFCFGYLLNGSPACNWQNYNHLGGFNYVHECKEPEFRCLPNSTNTVYYLAVDKVKSLD